MAALRTAFALALVLGTVAVGCGSASADLCDAVCECQNCSDKNYDECIVGSDAILDAADVYGCTPEAEDLFDCQIRKYRCMDGNFTVPAADCASAQKDFDSCIKSGSAIQ
jgi:hypothetical protein